MFFLKAAYCRIFQTAFRLALPLLPYREPTIVPSCAALDRVLDGEAITSVLIVTDRGIVEHGLCARLTEVLDNHHVPYVIYDKTKPNPTVNNVEEALALYHKHGCNALIAIGGGSPMDCAKAVGARVAYPKKRIEAMKGVLRVRRRIPTLIAAPTTAGTGSEVTLAAVVTDPEKQYKYAMMSFPLIPHYAVLDAALTYSLPPHLTATTGMDALTHAVEAYIGRSSTKETRARALKATALVFRYLERAYHHGDDHEAREAMLRAAYNAGIAFSKSYVGYIHAVAHSVGGQYNVPHGLANAVIMPYVLEAYGEVVYKKLHELGIAAGVSTPEDSHKVGADAFIQAIKDLNAAMEIPPTIDGIRKEDIPVMSAHAEQEANPLYPVPKLMTKDELARFYDQLIERSNRR